MSSVWVTNKVSGKEKITALNVLMKNIRKSDKLRIQSKKLQNKPQESRNNSDSTN